MSDTGWSLIPREGLPAPIPAVRRPVPPRPAQSPDAARQLSFFGAGTTEPSPADLAGLLAGPGHLGRMGGTARVSIPVDAAWRVHVLVAELVTRGLVVHWRPLIHDQDQTTEVRDVASENQQEEPIAVPATPTTPRAEPAGYKFEVVTAYSRRLNGLARAWPAAAARLFLTGARLRLWVAAAGEPVAGGYALGLNPAKDPVMIDSALVRAGLAGRLSDGGEHYLIMGGRRLRRLAELVGDRPAAAPEHLWPGGAGA